MTLALFLRNDRATFRRTPFAEVHAIETPPGCELIQTFGILALHVPQDSLTRTAWTAGMVWDAARYGRSGFRLMEQAAA